MRIFPDSLATFEKKNNGWNKSGRGFCEPDSDANQWG